MDINHLIDNFEKAKSSDFKHLKNAIINNGKRKTIKVGKTKNIKEHLIILSNEFNNCSLLTFYHAYLIVNIRRGINTHENAKKFFSLWENESAFLIKNLSSRWLISACDTISDYSDDVVEQSIATAIALFMTTIKVYESERIIYGYSEKNNINYRQEVILDGSISFHAKLDDTIFNMIQRLYAKRDMSKISWKILAELINRVHRYNTAFKRLAPLHQGSFNWFSNNKLFVEF